MHTFSIWTKTKTPIFIYDCCGNFVQVPQAFPVMVDDQIMLALVPTWHTIGKKFSNELRLSCPITGRGFGDYGKTIKEEIVQGFLDYCKGRKKTPATIVQNCRMNIISGRRVPESMFYNQPPKTPNYDEWTKWEVK